MKPNRLLPTILIAGLALAAGNAHAAATILVTPTSATSTSDIGPTRTLTETINGSQLFDGPQNTPFTAPLTVSNISGVYAAAATTFWKDANNVTIDGYWLSGTNGMGGTNPSTGLTLTFDLGGAFDLTTIYFWNYRRDGANNSRAIKTFNILFSTDGGTTYSTAVSASSLGIADFDQHATISGSGTEAYVPLQIRQFTDVQEGVTHIRFAGLETYGSSTLVGLAEIRFGAIPEPSVALLGGLGLLALLRRRRSS